MSTSKSLKSSRTSNVAIVRAVKQIAAAATHVEAALGDEPRILAPADKQRSVRLRKGGDAVMRRIFELAQTYQLDSGVLRSQEMLQGIQRLEALNPLEAVLTKLSALVENERFVAGSSAWQMALKFYAALQREALGNAVIAASIAPLEEFFTHRSDAVLASKPTKLQTRAKQKLAHAQRLVARAKDRADAAEAAAAHTEPSPQPATQAAPAAQPTPKVQTNGVTNGALNGASNGALNGANGAPTPNSG